MSVKTTGAEYKRYYTDTDPRFWPEGSFMDDYILVINGIPTDEDKAFDADSLKDDDAVVIESGVVIMGDTDEGTALTTHFKRWRKAQSTAFLSVEVSRDKLDAVKAAIIAAGGKVSA